MRSKGFTLIELLAVIVILAIIALIAVPIVLGIINDSKKSSEKESLNLYTDTVEKAITKKQMNNPSFNPDKCEIKDKGNLECFKGTTSLGTVEIEMKGQVPESGIVIIEGNNIKYENIVLNGKTYYEKTYAAFSIGDEITYKDTNWYVINNSPSSQNYVTLIKKTVLTHDELGEYALVIEGDDDVRNTAYFDYDSSLYATSDIKAAVETYMSNKSMTNDLKEVDGYKIRLITENEIMNLGYSEQEQPTPWDSNQTWVITTYTETTPTWIYSNFGEGQNGVSGYWTMSPYSNDNSNVLFISVGGLLSDNQGLSANGQGGVRPVINLLKSSISTQS